MKEYQPNEIIIDKAVKVWKNLLRRPKYDNGDSSIKGVITSTLASLVSNNTNDENLEVFGKELKKLLMNPDPEHKEKYDTIHYETYICVDYGPCKVLNEAAEKAGLKLEFPWKTNMVLRENYFSLSFGYCALYVHYYPLSNGKWLVTKLDGDDISKVIEYVEGGRPEFTIED